METIRSPERRFELELRGTKPQKRYAVLERLLLRGYCCLATNNRTGGMRQLAEKSV
jgi:hypothetical protein